MKLPYWRKYAPRRALGLSLSRRLIVGAGVWTPKSLDGCVLWLNADVGVTHGDYEGNELCSAWDDQSDIGTSLTQSASTQMPTWIPDSGWGKPALRFGVTAGPTNDQFDLSPAMSMSFPNEGDGPTMIVYQRKIIKADYNGVRLYETTGDNGSFSAYLMADGGATKLAQNLSHGAGGSWDANLGTGDAPDPGSAFHVCAQKHQDAAGGVESYGWMDTSAASAWKDDDGGYSYNNWAYDYDYNFDNLRAVGDNGTDCDVRHIIVYNRPLTDAEIELVRLWILEQEA